MGRSRREGRRGTWVVLACVAAAAAAVVCAWAWRGPIFRAAVAYRVDERIAPSEGSVDAIVADASVPPGAGILDLVELASELTGEALEFQLRGKDQGIARVTGTGRANCVGYARLMTAVLVRLIEMGGLDGDYEATHVRGPQIVLGVEFQRWSVVPEPLRDHDFVLVEDANGDAVMAADPSLEDAYGILEVRLAVE